MGVSLMACRGCLLGLAAGDALGLSVDKKNYDEILRDYGPHGILGYDLMNGAVAISSHTQLAAYACNGLLLGITRGNPFDGPVRYDAYLARALAEWARVQRGSADAVRNACWVSRVPELRNRRCMDETARELLASDRRGSIRQPVNRSNACGSMAASVAVGLFFEENRLPFHRIGTLGAQVIALSHGDPSAFLAGAAAAYAIAGIVHDQKLPLWQQFLLAGQAVKAQFGSRFPEASLLCDRISHTVSMAQQSGADHVADMNALGCDTASEALLGAVYACIACGGDFGEALTIAVNHSGRSAAVGALAGAFLGAQMGETAIPEFYLEALPAASALAQLADDMSLAAPRELALFDDDWDRKYIQGEPVDH